MSKDINFKPPGIEALVPPIGAEIDSIVSKGRQSGESGEVIVSVNQYIRSMNGANHG